MNKSPQDSQQVETEQRKPEVEEIYLSKLGNWSSIPENTGPIYRITKKKNIYTKHI